MNFVATKASNKIMYIVKNYLSSTALARPLFKSCLISFLTYFLPYFLSAYTLLISFVPKIRSKQATFNEALRQGIDGIDNHVYSRTKTLLLRYMHDLPELGDFF